MHRQVDIEAEVRRELARSRRMGLWLLAFAVISIALVTAYRLAKS